MKTRRSLSCSMALTFGIAGLAAGAVQAKESPAAHAEIKNADGKSIGRVEFTQGKGELLVSVRLKDLPPGEHGFHLHENGKCEGPKFESAGGHYNPLHKHHGLDNPQGAHAGDFPNLKVGSDGTATSEFRTYRLNAEKGKPGSIFKEGGVSVVIHEKADDEHTDPSGSSGNRIACGVVEK